MNFLQFVCTLLKEMECFLSCSNTDENILLILLSSLLISPISISIPLFIARFFLSLFVSI